MAIEWIAAWRVTRAASRETVKAAPASPASPGRSERASSMSLQSFMHLRCKLSVRAKWLRTEALQFVASHRG